MCETWRGLIKDFATNLLSLSTPTHTQDLNNHNDGYGHPKTALVQSFSGQPEISFFDGFETQKRFWNSTRITTFKIACCLFD
jgi:hypothetical protein